MIDSFEQDNIRYKRTDFQRCVELKPCLVIL